MPCSAIAGIGSPQRFFSQLSEMGIQLSSATPLADHHAITPSDIPNGRVLMTEKDAVKSGIIRPRRLLVSTRYRSFGARFFN